jgi:hypothetical protein
MVKLLRAAQQLLDFGHVARRAAIRGQRRAAMRLRDAEEPIPATPT